jgi:hypothetical protein
MFDRLSLPPGWTIRIDYDPDAGPLSVAISFGPAAKHEATLRVAPDRIPSAEALQRLIDALPDEPDPELVAEMRRRGHIDDEGKVTPEFLEASFRVLKCEGGPLAGQTLCIPGTAMEWTMPGHRLGAADDETVDPPEGGVYRVRASGMVMDWCRDGGTSPLPFRRKKRP